MKDVKGKIIYPLDTGRKQDVQNTSWMSPEHIMYVQFTFCVLGVLIIWILVDLAWFRMWKFSWKAHLVESAVSHNIT